uniref:hypothetical protein n=1 Tax=Burkholderia diffusa TaxID=488732 RepID=UPI001CC6E866|nr:hypothetical protein [Burkholderia diffusa]
MLKAQLNPYRAVPTQAIPIRLSCRNVEVPPQSLGIQVVRLGSAPISYMAVKPQDIDEFGLPCIRIKRHIDGTASRYRVSANPPSSGTVSKTEITPIYAANVCGITGVIDASCMGLLEQYASQSSVMSRRLSS